MFTENVLYIISRSPFDCMANVVVLMRTAKRGMAHKGRFRQRLQKGVKMKLFFAN
jgi:hypothetical protein